MKKLWLFSGFIALAIVTLGASFPYVTLNNKTNRLSDNGTAFTRNGVAIGGSGGISGTVSNNVASAGLLAVDATKTNGIAATAAHITNAWGIFTGDATKAVSGAGTLVSLPTAGSNYWHIAADYLSPSVTNSLSITNNVFLENMLVTTNGFGEQFVVGANDIMADFGEYIRPTIDNTSKGYSEIVALGFQALGNSGITNGTLINAVGVLPLWRSVITNSEALDFYGVKAGYNASIIGIGRPSSFLSAFGQSALKGSTIYGSHHLNAYGQDSLSTTTFTNNSSHIDAYGNGTGFSSTFDNASELWISGSANSAGSVFQNATNIVSIGLASLNTSSLSNVNDLIIVGNSTVSHWTNANLNHVVLLGSGSLVTNSNDYVFGDSAYNYKFPGASMTVAGSVSVGTTVETPILQASKAIRSYQGSLTHAGTVTLDFDGATTVNSMTVTGALTLAFSNLATNRTYRLLLKNDQATNCALTLPAGVQGYYTTTLSNGWHMTSFEAWGTVASNVWVSTSSNGTY